MAEASRKYLRMETNQPGTIVNKFQNSLKSEKRLFQTEIFVELAYCESLFEAGVLTRLESEKIKNALQTLAKRADFDRDYFSGNNFFSLSDFIEEKLVQLIGDTGRKLKIGRSLNEFQTTVFRSWLREEIIQISSFIREIQKTFVFLAESNSEQLFLLHNQSELTKPVLFGHWCLCCFEMLERDRERLDEVWRRTNTLPLGSVDGEGNSLEIDREELARKLKFEGISSNALDAVSDRDFILEILNVSNLLMIHLMRMIEEILFYEDQKVNFFILSRENSNNLLMSIRGKGSKLFGFQTFVLSNLKGSSLGFFSDFQEQNEIIFEGIDLIKNSLTVFDFVLSGLIPNKEKLNQQISRCRFFENEIFEYFIQRGLSYSEARKTTGIVKLTIENHMKTSTLTFDVLNEISPLIDFDFMDILIPEKAVRQKNQTGGTSPERFDEFLEEVKNKLKMED